MKKSLLILSLAILFYSCSNDTVEDKGIPKIINHRLLGDDGSGGYIENDTFIKPEQPYLELTALDDDMDIKKISIELYNDTFLWREVTIRELPEQEINPQEYIIHITEAVLCINKCTDNSWGLNFFLIDADGNESTKYTSPPFKICSPP